MSMVVTTRSEWLHRTGAPSALNPCLRSRARYGLLIIGDVSHRPA